MNTPWTTPEGDISEVTDEMVRQMRPLAKSNPELLDKIQIAQARRGRPRVEAPKKMQSFKLSQEVIAAIKASGSGFNARVDAVLRQAFLEQKL